MATGEQVETAGGGNAGSVLAALALAATVAAATIAFAFLTREEAEPLVLAVVAGLAGVGGLALVAMALGLLRVGALRGKPAALAPDHLADGLPEGIVVTDPAGRVVTANAAYAALAGIEDRGRAAVPSLERLLAGDPDAAEPVFRLAAAARQGVVAEEEVRLAHPIGRPDGSPRWYRLSVRPLPGKPPQRLWRVFDVTGERRDQETSFLELQNVIHFLDHAPAGFFSADAEGRIVYLNATLAAWLGHDLARLDAGRMTLAEMIRGDGAALLSALTGKPGDVRTETVDLDLVKKNGEPLPVRLMHRVSFGPGGAARDSRTLVLGRTAAIEAADTPRAAEVRFARFFNNAPIAIAAVDRSGRLGRTNAPFLKLFGALAHRPPGEPRPRLAEAVVERDRQALAEAVALVAAGRRLDAPVEATLAGEGGRSIRFYLSPVQEAGGDDEAAIVYALETTEQRALETQFAQSQKMQAVGQLAGGVAHDFNNLLTAIIGFADLVLTRYRPNDPFFQDVMAIKQNANRAAGLVRQLLAFSRRQTMRPERIVLNDVLADLTILLDRLLGETVELKVVNGRDLWPVMADVNQFEQVIVNLAVNARDAMPEGGRLTVRTANVPASESAAYAAHGIPPGDYVLTEIADTGKGMSPEVMEKIFEPFFTTKERGKGTGLGLSTVYGVVKQSNGYITVDSSPGEGTTFRVLLPRAAGEGGVRTSAGEDGRPILVRGRGAPQAPAETGGPAGAPPAAAPTPTAPAPAEVAAPAGPAAATAIDTAAAIPPAAAAPAAAASPPAPPAAAARTVDTPAPQAAARSAEPASVVAMRRDAGGGVFVAGSVADRSRRETPPPAAAASEPVDAAAPAPTAIDAPAAGETPPEPVAEQPAEPARRREPPLPPSEVFVRGSVAGRAVRSDTQPLDSSPADADAPPPAGAGAGASGVADLTGSAAILLVEDEDAVRAFATRALASRGYTVHPAASGAEALKVMEEVGGRIDLVVSDVVMPEMDGPTLLRELRRTRPDLKIIFVSGYAEDAFARNLPANEHFSFLPKPFTLKQLAMAVKTVLAGEEDRPD